jgi:hypothetical protein
MQPPARPAGHTLALKGWSNLQQDYRKEAAAIDLSALYKATMFSVIDPQKSWKLRCWDALTVVLILYMAFAGPYQARPLPKAVCCCLAHSTHLPSSAKQ